MATKPNKKTPAKNPNNPNVIVHQVTVKPLNRQTPELDQWKSAMQQAEMGRRAALMNLLTKLMDDPLLSSVVEKRVLAVTNSEWVFQDATGKEVDEINTLIDSPAFENVLEEVQKTLLFGHTVLELNKDAMGNLTSELIPRTHVRPDLGIIGKEEGDEDGFHYREIPHVYYCLEAGKPRDFGILFKAAPFVILKTANLADWAQLAEIMGIPMRVGEYDIEDIKSKLALEQSFDQGGSAPWITIPKGTSVRIENGAANSNGEIFEKFKDACREEIIILLLGQTMTTMDGSSRSQGEVHLKVEESLHKQDRRRVRRVLNEKLIPILENLGYPVTGGKFAVKDESKLSTKEKLEILNIVKANTPVSDDEYYTTSGVPKPDNYDELKKEASTPPTPPEPDPKKPEEKKKEKAPVKKLSWENLNWETFKSFFIEAE